MYQQFNNNPKGKKTSDCVIRAFSLATGKTWESTLTDLYKLALKFKSIPNDKSIYTKYAESLGFVRCQVDKKDKPTVFEFCQMNPTGTYILRLAGHLVTVVNGCYFDSWDCGNKSVYMYWKVQ